MNMHYKTIVLELIRQHPELYNQLHCNRMLLPALCHFAKQLKTSHEAWKRIVCRLTPDWNESQIAGEALEFALMEMENFLNSMVPPDDGEEMLIQSIMAFVRGRPPPEH
jgi:hypothetical protein